MWGKYIGQEMRRCNRNLLIANLLLLGVLATGAGFNTRYLKNFLSGATDISNSELAQLHGPDERTKFFVTVHGGEVFYTGLQSIEQTVDDVTKQVRSTTVKAEYRILAVGDRLLVVKTDPGASGTVFTGALEPIPANLYEQIVAAAPRNELPVQGTFIPVMLNANDYRNKGWWMVGIGIPALLLAGRNLWTWQRRITDHSCHPIYKRISTFGAPEQVVERIDAAMRTDPCNKIGGVRLYGPWLFRPSLYRLTFFHVPDLVWVYQKVVKRSVNFIPTGKSFFVVLNDRYGYNAEFQERKKNVELLITHLLQESPWAIAGFSNEVKQMWRSQRAALIATVDEQRNKSAKAAQAVSGQHSALS